MIPAPRNILVFHTAFIGDIVLALPLTQRLHQTFPDAKITFVAAPGAAPVLANHPAIHRTIVYDKQRSEAGVRGIIRLARTLRRDQFDLAIIPHRSLRSAIVCRLSGIPRRVGFSTSAATWMFTDVVRYDGGIHEVERNISLLGPLGVANLDFEAPALFPSSVDARAVVRFLAGETLNPESSLIGIAPGSVWNTKRWPKEYFVLLTTMLVRWGASVVLVGGKEDEGLCSEIAGAVRSHEVLNAAGKLSLLQSAELIRRCILLVSNDSAPMHLAAGVKTPVVAIFGPTVPAFGFAPRGAHDIVIELQDLDCRPCSIHGGKACPIKTFVCMKEIRPEVIFEKVLEVAGRTKAEAK